MYCAGRVAKATTDKISPNPLELGSIRPRPRERGRSVAPLVAPPKSVTVRGHFRTRRIGCIGMIDQDNTALSFLKVYFAVGLVWNPS